jgi:putative restriction endonuclease
MAFGVFVHRPDSIYDDQPQVHYQFPAMYLTRARPCIGDWIVYLEPRRVRGSRGYFAVAKVDAIIPDPRVPNMHLAVITPGTYLPFVNPVPFNGPEGVFERGVLNASGRNSGRAQASVRPLAPADFARIVHRGFQSSEDYLPRTDAPAPHFGLQEAQMPFDAAVERERVTQLTSRLFRDRIFRRLVLQAYDERCCMTGLKLINGGGRAEAQAAHIRPVEFHGPDIVTNGLALSGTMHWMFDRGLVSVAEDHEILVSRQVNDARSVHELLNRSRCLRLPRLKRDWPDQRFLTWHRENRFKA